MALLEILKYPDPRLKKKAEPVSNITDEIKRLAADMTETMYAAPGVGLAATQVGKHIRLIVIDIGDRDNRSGVRNPITLVNPEFIERSGEILWEEGCLSVPEYTSDVKRFEKVVVKGLDLDGRERVIPAEGLLAVVFQHEIDHLDGTLFIDRLGPIKRDLVRRKLRKQARAETV